MSDASERFLDLATKPLEGNHELRVHSRWEIGSRLKADADELLEEASNRLEKSDRSKWKPAWISLGLVLLGMGLLGLSAWKWVPQRHAAKLMFGLDRFEISHEELTEMNRQMATRLPSEDRMFIEYQFDKLKALHPTEPLYFAPGLQYACDWEQYRKGKVPTGLMDEVIKIDPENGWWPYFKANYLSSRLATVIDPRSGAFLDWEPEEQEKIDQILQIYHQAASSRRFESYQTEIKSRKIALLPPIETVEDCASRLVYTSFFSVQSESLSYMDGILAVQARKLAERNDIPGFRMLLNDWITVSRNRALDFNQMRDLYPRIYSYQGTLPSFLKASQDLGLHDEARALRESKAVLDRLSLPYPTNKAHKQAFRFHGSILTSLASQSGDDCGMGGDYFDGRYPPITAERLKPNRRSERAYIAQLLTLPLGVLLLVISAILFVFRYRNGRLCRETSGRLADLFDRSDWFYCIGFGVLFPILYFAVIRYFTPFGGLDRNEGLNGQYLERARFMLLFLLIVSCSLLTLRRRLRERMNFLESPSKRARFGRDLTIAGFVILPLLGCCFRIQQDRYFSLNMAILIPSLLLMGTLVVWLAVLMIRFLFGNPEQALRRQTLSRLMAHTMIWAFAIVCGAIPFHMAEERFWVKRDTVLRADPEHPAITRYEWEVIQQMKGELLGVLAPLEAISR